MKLRPIVGETFTLQEYSGKALEAVKNQWEPNGRNPDTAWDWKELVRHHRKDPDLLTMAIWCESRLSGLSLATTSSQGLIIRYLEGDPREDCPLYGKRALIVLEACAGYAQARGKSELRILPLNESLEQFYIDLYGFDVCKPKNAEPYLFLRV